MPDWEMWRWIKAMVQNNQLNDETIDKLVIVFKKAMDQIMSYIKENKIEEKINKIEQPYALILYKMYIKGKKLVTVASEMNYNYTYMCEMHGKALQKYKNITE